LGGGGGVACYQIAQELAKTHQVDYLTTGYKGLPRTEQRDGINIHRVPVMGRKDLSTAALSSMISFFPACLLRGIRLCLKNNYDVINAHFVIPSGLPAVFLAKIFRKPLVISILGGDIYDPSKKWSPHRHPSLQVLIGWLLRQANRIVAESNDIKEKAARYYVYSRQAETIPLGFVQPQYQKVTRADLGLPEDQIILISVGRLVKRKGYEYAIRAVSHLVKKGHWIKYLIIGEGPEERALQNLSKELKIEENIIFLGYVPEEVKYRYLSQSDIYLLPSLHEGFGVCLLEAMYCGLPIVATNNGGQTDFLVDGKNALLVPIKNWQILAEKIDEICCDRSKRDKMSINNRKDIKKYYIQEIAAQYEKIFDTEKGST
jgi:glycosyltransferase involved in cell wall biosynthesis